MEIRVSRAAVAAGVAAVVAVGAVGGGMALAAGSHASGTVTISAKKTSIGTVLVAGPKQHTVYMFSEDHGTKSACDSSTACASFWPPVKTTGMPKPGSGVTAVQIGTAKEGKFLQATYHGHLLYYFAPDKKAGDVKGQLINAKGTTGGTPVWFALSPSGAKITKKPPTSSSASDTSTGTSTGTKTSPAAGGGGGSAWE
jgi:predicted lipoprotein with Yx(FWY)xxD motif